MEFMAVVGDIVGFWDGWTFCAFYTLVTLGLIDCFITGRHQVLVLGVI